MFLITDNISKIKNFITIVKKVTLFINYIYHKYKKGYFNTKKVHLKP
jgi:hypothetical protein